MRPGDGTPGPGRPKGSKNKKVGPNRRETALNILNSGLTPLDIMWGMARGTRKFDPRKLAAAAACAPYVHPKLQMVKISAEEGGGALHQLSHEDALEMLDSAEPQGMLEVRERLKSLPRMRPAKALEVLQELEQTA